MAYRADDAPAFPFRGSLNEWAVAHRRTPLLREMFRAARGEDTIRGKNPTSRCAAFANDVVMNRWSALASNGACMWMRFRVFIDLTTGRHRTVLGMVARGRRQTMHDGKDHPLPSIL
jgi:hypothetical protein